MSFFSPLSLTFKLLFLLSESKKAFQFGTSVIHLWFKVRSCQLCQKFSYFLENHPVCDQRWLKDDISLSPFKLPLRDTTTHDLHWIRLSVVTLNTVQIQLAKLLALFLYYLLAYTQCWLLCCDKYFGYNNRKLTQAICIFIRMTTSQNIPAPNVNHLQSCYFYCSQRFT